MHRARCQGRVNTPEQLGWRRKRLHLGRNREGAGALGETCKLSIESSNRARTSKFERHHGTTCPTQISKRFQKHPKSTQNRAWREPGGGSRDMLLPMIPKSGYGVPKEELLGVPRDTIFVSFWGVAFSPLSSTRINTKSVPEGSQIQRFLVYFLRYCASRADSGF